MSGDFYGTYSNKYEILKIWYQSNIGDIIKNNFTEQLQYQQKIKNSLRIFLKLKNSKSYFRFKMK